MGLPDNAIPLGHDVFYTESRDPDGRWVAIMEFHRHGDRWNGGFIPFDVPSEYLTDGSEKWTVESYDPLTLSPSLLCTACGNHGFIRDGRWVPA